MVVCTFNHSRIPDRVLRWTRQPLPATGLLPGPAGQSDQRKKRRRPVWQPRAPDHTEERVPAESTAVHLQRRASERQHDRHHRPAQKTAASSGGHRLGPPALVLLWEAPHRQDPPARHQDPEGLCHPGHREPAAHTRPLGWTTKGWRTKPQQLKEHRTTKMNRDHRATWSCCSGGASQRASSRTSGETNKPIASWAELPTWIWLWSTQSLLTVLWKRSLPFKDNRTSFCTREYLRIAVPWKKSKCWFYFAYEARSVTFTRFVF